MVAPDGGFVYWINDDGSEFRTYRVNGEALVFDHATDLRSFVGTDLSVVSAAFVPDATLPTEYRIWALEQNTNQLLNIAVTKNTGTVTFANLTGSSPNLNITEVNEIAFRDRNRLYFTQTQSNETLGSLSLDSNGLPIGNITFREGEQRGLAVTSDDMVYSVQNLALSHWKPGMHRRYLQHELVTTPLCEHFTDVAAGPDGDVYAISEQDSALVQLRPNNLTGEFERVKTIVDGIGRNEGLYFPSSVTVSDDGLQVFVTSPLRNKIGAFVKDSATGTLRFASSVDFAGVKKVVFRGADDGGLLYAIGSAADSFASIDVASSGGLTFLGTVSDIGLNGGIPTDIVVSPGGEVAAITRSDVAGDGRVGTVFFGQTETAVVTDPRRLVTTADTLYVATSDRILLFAGVEAFGFGHRSSVIGHRSTIDDRLDPWNLHSHRYDPHAGRSFSGGDQ